MKIRAWHVAAAIIGSVAVSTAVSNKVMAQDDPLPPGPGKQVLLDSCSSCHDASLVAGQKRSPSDWDDVVSRMVGMGASVNDDQYKAITTYLNTNFGTGAPPAAPAAAAAPTGAAPAAAAMPAAH
jgi:mono/diheme cytochrome c family protein